MNTRLHQLWIGAFLLMFGGAMPALSQSLPPLIDRELFFGDPEIAGTQLSPDGQYIAFLKPFKGTRNIWVKRTDESFDKARPLTADTKRPIGGLFWSRDAKFILYTQDTGGDENFNVYAVRPEQQPAPGKDVPEEIHQANGGKNILWIAKTPRRMVKSVTTGPQLGGATLTAELQP